MAEPAGFFLEVAIAEVHIKKLLAGKFNAAPFQQKLGFYFSSILHECSASGDVFHFHFDVGSNRLFIAWLHHYFSPQLIEKFAEVLPFINVLRQKNTNAYALVATSFPDVLWGYELSESALTKLDATEIPQEVTKQLMDKFWSFSAKGSFPEPEKAMRKRNYFAKVFKDYYKKYLVYLRQQEKPKRIAEATAEKPYHLFNDFYTYDNKVFEFRTYTKQVIELPEADPLSFRNVTGFAADKNHLFHNRLASGSPSKSIQHSSGSGTINNPGAIWEYYVVEGIDGASFDYIKERWDTVYWKDIKAVYVFEDGFKKVADADLASFDYLDFCYGKDRAHVFYKDRIIGIDVHAFTLNIYGFIFDRTNIYHYETQIHLDAPTFKVEQYETTITPPVIGRFVLADKNGRYEYDSRTVEKKVIPIV